MNGTTTRFCCYVFAMAGLAAASLPAARGDSYASVLVPWLVAAQAKPAANAPALTRQDVGKILAQVRQAMTKGALEEAESLLRHAEGAQIRYPVLNFEDTPAKVRRDLDRLVKLQPAKQLIGGGAAKSGSHTSQTADQKSELADLFPVDLGDRYSRTTNPFPNPDSPSAPLPNQTSTLSPAAVIGGKTAPPQVSPSVPILATQTKQIGQRATSDGHLHAARLALATGDVAQAEAHLSQALEQRVDYDGSADSPHQVASSISRYHQLSEQTNGNRDDPIWREGYSKLMIEQANALIAWDDLESAERVASEVVQLGMNTGSATGVLRHIQQLRQGATSNPTAQIASKAPKPDSKRQTTELLVAARMALASGNLQEAERLAVKASRLGVVDSQFSPNEDSPAKLAADLQRAHIEKDQVVPATAVAPLPVLPRLAERTPELAPVRAQQRPISEAPMQLTQLPATELVLPQPKETAAEVLQLGMEALRRGETTLASEILLHAHQRRHELDPQSRQLLQDHLQMLSAEASTTPAAPPAGSLIESTSSAQTVLARQLSAEIGKRQSDASHLRTTDPNQAIGVLEEARQLVEQSELDSSTKTQLLRRIALSKADTEQYIREHQAELNLEQSNREVLEEIDRSREVKLQIQQRVAELLEQFNQLRDEQRYAEMEMVAKRLYDMAPDEPVAKQVWEHAKFIRRTMLNEELDNLTEEGVVGVFQDLRRTAGEALVDSTRPITYNAETWGGLKKRRGSSEASSRRTAREIEIQRKLRTPVQPRYEEMPLADVMQQLSELTGVNIHLDQRGLSQEGIQSNELVSLYLGQEISLESVLNLILEPLRLTYTIKDEVLKITSEQLRDGDVYPVTYNVADLVIPIPNFVPTSDTGLQGLINDAYSSMGYGGGGGLQGPLTVMAQNQQPGSSGAPLEGNALAQQFGPGTGASGTSVPFSGGPGGLGGGAQADFDSLIDLIVSTVEHDSWMENGTGEGEIQPFPTNLSLVISQTQRVHEQIADLLEQLRRLQDLQVTIEVRFIRLTDSFFERIGIDFDFNIEDGSGINDLGVIGGGNFEPPRASATVGISANPTGIGDPLPDFTVGLDVPFRQSAFGLAEPAFGTPQDVGTFGFAILSDIEAFFLIEASQGDARANVLQAPKVTLFNGQFANVIDTAFMPFVISVIPVVGEFAAAQQPVIVVLSEGTMLSVQAVVSDDRRYVRLTLVPFFSQVGEVQTFTFEGSETSTSSSNTTDQDDDGNDENDDNSNQVTRSGTTVQLPTFEVIQVSTTVSVPDGGTVLLGGIKRLREGRAEFGVPLLSKVPYIDRLFRNVGIGRETDSLMMMVTPHIIIQEEEEEKLGISSE